MWQKINGLGFVSCIVIGDILNRKQNCLTIISADGWCHIYCCLKNMKNDADIEQATTVMPEETSSVDGIVFSAPNNGNSNMEEKNSNEDTIKQNSEFLQCIHIQRIPANSKVW